MLEEVISLPHFLQYIFVFSFYMHKSLTKYLYIIYNTNILLVNWKNTKKYCILNARFLYKFVNFSTVCEEQLHMEIGERLAKVRKETGYTQKDIADILNVSQQVISNIERNATSPDIDFLRGLADLYCMSLDELIERQIVPKQGNGIEQKIMNIIEKLDDTGKELSLSLIKQVAQHQENNEAK